MAEYSITSIFNITSTWQQSSSIEVYIWVIKKFAIFHQHIDLDQIQNDTRYRHARVVSCYSDINMIYQTASLLMTLSGDSAIMNLFTSSILETQHTLSSSLSYAKQVPMFWR